MDEKVDLMKRIFGALGCLIGAGLLIWLGVYQFNGMQLAVQKGETGNFEGVGLVGIIFLIVALVVGFIHFVTDCDLFDGGGSDGAGF